GWDQFQVEFGRGLRSTGLCIIDCPGVATLFTVVPRGYSIFPQSEVAFPFGYNLELVFVSFDRQGGVACAKKRARCLDSIQQTTSFLTDVVDPFAKVGVGGPFAVPFYPHVMSIGGIDN